MLSSDPLKAKEEFVALSNFQMNISCPKNPAVCSFSSLPSIPDFVDSANGLGICVKSCLRHLCQKLRWIYVLKVALDICADCIFQTHVSKWCCMNMCHLCHMTHNSHICRPILRNGRCTCFAHNSHNFTFTWVLIRQANSTNETESLIILLSWWRFRHGFSRYVQTC